MCGIQTATRQTIVASVKTQRRGNTTSALCRNILTCPQYLHGGSHATFPTTSSWVSANASIQSVSKNLGLVKKINHKTRTVLCVPCMHVRDNKVGSFHYTDQNDLSSIRQFFKALNIFMPHLQAPQLYYFTLLCLIYTVQLVLMQHGSFVKISKTAPKKKAMRYISHAVFIKAMARNIFYCDSYL